MVNLDTQTELFDSFQATCDVVHDDIIWLDGNLPDGVRGQAPCIIWISHDPDVCDSYDIVLDPAELNEGSNDELDTTKTACHEVGHTVGLSHSPTGDDCMRSGEIPSTDVKWRKYNSHHVGHINNYY